MSPGTGALEYARKLTEGLTREQAAVAIRTHMSECNRVKRCDYCGHYWLDESSRNRKRTCSDECKTGIKTLQRGQQRADKALMTGKSPKKKTKREINYIWWLEYPFWLSEYEMLKQTWKREVPTEIQTMDFVSSQLQIYGPGNRKKRAEQSEED
ncbi:hypothetical protein AB4Z21_29035 [Paenibacillus sp. MCAF20]